MSATAEKALTKAQEVVERTQGLIQEQQGGITTLRLIRDHSKQAMILCYLPLADNDGKSVPRRASAEPAGVSENMG